MLRSLISDQKSSPLSCDNNSAIGCPLVMKLDLLKYFKSRTSIDESNQHYDLTIFCLPESVDHTLQHRLGQESCTLQNVRKCESFWFSSSLFFKLPMMCTKLFSSLASSALPSLNGTSSNALLTHSSTSLTTAFESGQSGNWGPNCSPKHPHQLPVPACLWLCSHQKVKWSLHLLQLNTIFQLLNDVANELFHCWFTYSFIKFLDYLILRLVNLSANNEVSMPFQGHIEERQSSVP